MDPTVAVRSCQACGANEAEVHLPGCATWIASQSGQMECPKCGGQFSALCNGLCGVCAYWAKKGA